MADTSRLPVDLDIDALLASLDPDSAPPPVSCPSGAVAATDHPEERRSAPRRTPAELPGDIRLAIPGISDILLVNISETGVLIETSRPLSPGTTSDLFVRRNGTRHVLRATTVRSTLRAITSTLKAVYRTALQFDRRLPL